MLLLLDVMQWVTVGYHTITPTLTLRRAEAANPGVFDVALISVSLSLSLSHFHIPQVESRRWK